MTIFVSLEFELDTYFSNLVFTQNNLKIMLNNQYGHMTRKFRNKRR